MLNATRGAIKHPRAANHNQPLMKKGLIMTDISIDNFRYFLEDLEKNLRQIEALLEKASILLKSAHVSYGVMAKMCENWNNQLEHK